MAASDLAEEPPALPEQLVPGRTSALRLWDTDEYLQRRRLLARIRAGDAAALAEWRRRYHCRLVLLDGRPVTEDRP